jgi:hypothetical protein
LLDLLNILICFDKNHQVRLTPVNIFYNIQIAQTAHNGNLKSVVILREQIGGIR